MTLKGALRIFIYLMRGELCISNISCMMPDLLGINVFLYISFIGTFVLLFIKYSKIKILLKYFQSKTLKY